MPSVGDRPSRKLARQTLAEVVEPRYEELFSLIRDELRHSGFEDMVAAGIVLTGGSSKMEGAIELAEEVFHMPVRLGLPQHVRGLGDVVKNPIHATGVGLLLYFFVLIIWTCILVLPLLLGIYSRGFINRIDYTYAQPNVHYVNEFYAVASVGEEGEARAYSTMANNELISNPMEAPSLSITHVDSNNDDKPEEIDIDFSFKKTVDDQVKGISFLINLDYALLDTVNAEFKTLVYLPIQSPDEEKGIASVKYLGHLEL